MLGKWLAIITAVIVAVIGLIAGLGLFHGDDPVEPDAFEASDASQIAASFSAYYSGFFGDDFYLDEGYSKDSAKAFYPNGSSAGYGSGSNYIQFYVTDDKNAAKERFDANKKIYSDQIGTTVMGSAVKGVYDKSMLNDAIGYYNNFTMSKASSYAYYTGYYENAFFEGYIYLPGKTIAGTEFGSLAYEIYKAIRNPVSVDRAKTYVEPGPVADLTVYDVDSNLLLVYGNANNDSKIDANDLAIIRSYADGKSTWVPSLAPYADANADGVIDQKDTAIVENIIAGNSTVIYYKELYESLGSNVESVIWPMTVNTIGVYQYQAGILLNFLGLWDKVTYADDTTIGSTIYFDTSKVKSYGAYSNKIMRNTDGLEMFYNSKVDVLVLNGYYDDNEVKNGLAKMGSKTQVIKPYSQGTYCLSSVVTFGFLLGADKAADEYIQFYEGVKDYLDGCFQDLPAKDYKTFLMPSNPDDTGAIEIDTAGANGMYPDVAWVLTLPAINKIPVGDNNRYIAVRSAEWFTQPENSVDYIMLSMYGLSRKTPANDVAATLDVYKEAFKQTSSYKNGNIIGFNYSYENGMFAPGMIAIIASYMYPDLVSESKAWELFEQFFGKYDKNGSEAAKVYAGVYKMTGNSGTDVPDAPESTYCWVYGNANMDNYVNADDITYIQLIIDGKKAATKYADANFDGVIDSKDIQQVQDIIDGKGVKRYYTMDNGETGFIRGQIKTLGAQYYANMYAIAAMGATGIVTCGDDETAKLANNGEFGEVVKNQNLKNYGYTKTYEPETLLSMHVDAILCGTTYFKNWEEMYWNDGDRYIAFIRLACWQVDPVAAVVTVANLLENQDYVDKAVSYAEYSDSITGMVNEAVSKLTDKKSVLLIYPYKNGNMEFQGPTTGCYEASLMAGLRNLATGVCDPEADKDEGFHVVDLEECLRYNPDALIMISGCGWSKTQENVNDSNTNYVKAFLSPMDAVKNGNVWFTSWRFTQGVFQPVGAIMMASEIYGSDLFPGMDAMSELQKYVDEFTSVNLGLDKGDPGYLDVTKSGMYFNKATN